MTLTALKSPNDMGFVGALKGMSLADLLQIKNSCKFSGCLSVVRNHQKGLIFFRDGELVHAELGDLDGLDAFFAIMLWKGGEFHAEPKIATTCHTINDSLTFLLLEAHRLQDEHGRTEIQTDTIHAELPGEVKPQARTSSINTRLANIPEIKYAVVLSKEGIPVDDDSFKGAEYAATGMFLSMFTSSFGHELGLGELVSATVHGDQSHLLLFKSKNSYLNVVAAGSSQPTAVEARLRQAMAHKQGA